jgi:hypothetical protein
MEKGDSFPFRPDAGSLVDEPNACRATPFEGSIEVVDGEANVMYARTAPRDEFSDRGIGALRLQQLDEGFSRLEPRDPGAVRIVEVGLGEAEDVAAEGQEVTEGADGNPDMGDSRPPALG